MNRLQDRESDEELVERALAGDRQAFGRFLRRHELGVFGLLLRMVRDRQRAEDLTQDAFVAAYRALAAGRCNPQGGSPRGWLYVIATNQGRNDLRRRAVESASLRKQAPPEGVPDASAAIEGAELRGRLDGMVDELPEQLKTALVLYDIDGFSFEEVGRVLDCSIRTARRHVHEARLRLARQIVDANLLGENRHGG